MCVPASQRFAGKVGEIFLEVGRFILKGNKFLYERRERYNNNFL